MRQIKNNINLLTEWHERMVTFEINKTFTDFIIFYTFYRIEELTQLKI